MLNLQLSVTYLQPTVEGEVALGTSAEVDDTEAQTVLNDGRSVLTGSEDGTAKLWSVETMGLHIDAFRLS